MDKGGLSTKQYRHFSVKGGGGGGIFFFVLGTAPKDKLPAFLHGKIVLGKLFFINKLKPNLDLSSQVGYNTKI